MVSLDIPLGGGGVGYSPPLPCVREESELVYRRVTCAAEGRGPDLMDAVHVNELVSALVVCDEEQFDWPFSRREGGRVAI